MLTSLNFLNKGAQWPPEDAETSARREMYRENRLIFEGDHAEVYQQQFKRIDRVISNFSDIISYPVILNYQKLISLKTADLLFGEAPQISITKKEGSTSIKALETTLKKIKKKSNLINTCYVSAIDISRYGDGLLYIYQDAGEGIIDVTQPRLWFPIVNADNLKKRIYEVLAWQITDEEDQDFLKVLIYSKTELETRIYKLTGSELQIAGKYTIEDLVKTETIPTGLSDFAVIQIPNTITSDRVTGIDDYKDVDSILSEIMIRITQISIILDKHAAPSISGPAAALEKDHRTGEWRLKMGNFFSRNTKEDPEVKYITWDGKTESNFKQIEILINQLYIISEMGAALLGDFSNTNSGQVPSGTAMRRMMMSALSKVNRIRMKFDPALKKAISLASELYPGKKIEEEDITINWQDGLPSDPSEAANIESIRTAGKATTSITSAIKRLDDTDDDGAMKEYEAILTDEQPQEGM